MRPFVPRPDDQCSDKCALFVHEQQVTVMGDYMAISFRHSFVISFSFVYFFATFERLVSLGVCNDWNSF